MHQQHDQSLDVTSSLSGSTVGPESQADVPVPSGSVRQETIGGVPILGEVTTAEVIGPPRGPRLVLPLVLFVATCFSTYYAVMEHFGWSSTVAFQFMSATMAILLAHEAGHYFQTLRYRVRASLPFFIPMPMAPWGTMGAVIGMSGSTADRKQLFDIGLSGPLAGLVLAIPFSIVGIMTADFTTPEVMGNAGGGIEFADPLLFKLIMRQFRPELPEDVILFLNPWLFAGWVGMLITGLNMMPVGQLDGGHVAHAVLGRGARYLAYGVIASAVLYMVWLRQPVWILMVILIVMFGITHPPTANDAAPIGWGRRVLGLVSLAIPIFCFSPNPIRFLGG
ncbi:MAG: site-2 protease family protein [Pirellulales bacterium]|nr:site-2 protease family protein [Planctomycetales bacterium]